MCCCLRSGMSRIDGILFARDNEAVKSVFHVRRRVGFTPKTVDIGFVFREEQLRRAFTQQSAFTELRVRGRYAFVSDLSQGGFRLVVCR